MRRTVGIEGVARRAGADGRAGTGGGVAGHNGLRSIAEQLGSRDFKRVRVGIGHPGHKDLVTGHVLGDFAADDQEWVARLLEAFVEAVPLLAAGDDAGCMNRIALRMQPPKVASQEASSVPDR